MTVNGIVKNGVVVLEEGVKLTEGTQVKVEIAPAEKGLLPEEVMKFAGSLKGDYPRDFARNHDHYIHGTPKRQESQ